jgi:hypothetical protein
MKTIFHATIDGKEVVLGFGDANGFIDPRATETKIAPMLEALPETMQRLALETELADLRTKAAVALNEASKNTPAVLPDGKVLSVGNQELMRRYNGEYQMHLGSVAEAEKRIPAIVGAFEAARAKLVVENAVYTHPKPGEDLMEDADAAEMAAKFATKGDGKALLLTGEYIADLRGRDFWLASPWRHMVIDKLGEEIPAGAITPDQLTAGQLSDIAMEQEAQRISALSQEQRDAEVARAKAAALTSAAQTRSELEIAGDTKALAKSQAQYAQALAEIDAKYGA